MKPMTIQEIYDYAKLSTLAYVDLSTSVSPKNPDKIIEVAKGDDPPGNSARIPEALGRQMFDPSKPADVTGRWKILDPYFKRSDDTGHSDPASGFAAMLVHNATYGKVLAIAGTEPKAPKQFGQDLKEADIRQIGFWGAALGQLVSLYNYIQVLRAPKGATVEQLELKESLTPPENHHYLSLPSMISDPVASEKQTSYIWIEKSSTSGTGRGLIGADEKIAVTGHSLGGHLAALATALLPDVFTTATIFNAPGYNPPSSRLNFPTGGADKLLGLFKPFGLQPAAVASVTGRVANFESEDAQTGDDWDVISGAGTGSSFSTDRNITIEKNTHDIGAILDTLGIQKLFAQLDPAFDIDKGGQILKAASAITNSSNETLLRALHQLITGQTLTGLPDTGPTQSDTIWESGCGDFAARSIYHDKLIALAGNERFKALSGKATVALLPGQSAEGIAARASGKDDVGLAYRYALRELNPFALIGADYSAHNADGSLDLYDEATGKGAMSEAYLQDRAVMLAWLNHANSADTNSLNGVDYGQFDSKGWRFTDKTQNRSIEISGLQDIEHEPSPRIISFGGAEAEEITGGTESDRLYGGDGNDTLKGDVGDDYLEGGQGDDQLIGGAGADTLNGGAGNDTYLLDDKDDAIDTIEDADGKGSIKLGQTLITGKFGQAAQNKSELYFTADYQYQLRDLKNGTWRLYRNNGNNTYRAL